MLSLIEIIFISLGASLVIGLIYFAFISSQENELYTVKISLAFSLGSFLVWLFVYFFLSEFVMLVILRMTAILGLISGISFLPLLNQNKEKIQTPTVRKDERDIPFARIRLQEGSETYAQYYAMRPENEEIDRLARKRPGLMSPKSRFNDPILYAATAASFYMTEFERDAVDGNNAYTNVDLSKEKASLLIKNITKHYGALDVGITTLNPEHVYSHIGRGAGVYGEEIKIEHAYAIAFTVEMNFELIKTAPLAPGCMESAHQYVEAASAAIQLAAFIRNLGFEARAQIDGNYQVIAPLVARDAGLGELSRMGLLISPKKGPRVRLGVVTTTMPLIPDIYIPNHAILNFCQICKKCARTCPSQSISYEARKVIDSALQWKIDPISCFNFWNMAGTDCGVCMAVCPFSHPDNFAHNLIRFGIQHSKLFRYLANFMDDIFYGKKPKSHPYPSWLKEIY